ncbi:MAG: hypothetical protein WC878_08305 [Candidatus Paceibacterota bacterium]|jgi:hypothetical protein
METENIDNGEGKELTFGEQAVDALDQGEFEDAYFLFKKDEAENPAPEAKGMAWGEEIKNVKMPRSEIIARQYWLPKEIEMAEEAEKEHSFETAAGHYAAAAHIYREFLHEPENAKKMDEKEFAVSGEEKIKKTA